jgi:hypothetical protein
MGLPLSGTLVADATGCLYVISEDGWRYTLLWPRGFSAERRATGVVVLDAQRRVVARTNDQVTLSGGVTPPSGVLGSCAPSRTDFYEINKDFLPEG